MAVEERKFTNTVVVTASRDTLLLGGRGTRRERKLPQRYQVPVPDAIGVSCKAFESRYFKGIVSRDIDGLFMILSYSLDVGPLPLGILFFFNFMFSYFNININVGAV
jgi:hypothetical protein